MCVPQPYDMQAILLEPNNANGVDFSDDESQLFIRSGKVLWVHELNPNETAPIIHNSSRSDLSIEDLTLEYGLKMFELVQNDLVVFSFGGLYQLAGFNPQSGNVRWINYAVNFDTAGHSTNPLTHPEEESGYVGVVANGRVIFLYEAGIVQFFSALTGAPLTGPANLGGLVSEKKYPSCYSCWIRSIRITDENNIILDMGEYEFFRAIDLEISPRR